MSKPESPQIPSPIRSRVKNLLPDPSNSKTVEKLQVNQHWSSPSNIPYLMLIHKELKTLCNARYRPMPLGKRTHDLWVMHNECRVHTCLLNKVANQLQSTWSTNSTYFLSRNPKQRSQLVMCTRTNIGYA
jgi:hypothetical protein